MVPERITILWKIGPMYALKLTQRQVKRMSQQAFELRERLLFGGQHRVLMFDQPRGFFEFVV